jgi:hypothetical protein
MKLAEDLAEMQRATTTELQKANEALAQLRGQTEELDPILKAVE